MRTLGSLLANNAAPARLAAAIAIVIGVAALSGWLLGIGTLVSVVPGSVEMKFNTALATVACGLALVILVDKSSRRFWPVAQLLGLATAGLAAATLAEYLLGIQIGIDELLVHDPAGAFNVFRGRMSPLSASAFAAIGIALTSLPYGRLQGFAKVGASLGLFIGSVSLLGYAWDAGELVTDRWLPPVALNTAASFTLLSGGILLAPARSDLSLEQRVAELSNVEIKILCGFVFALLALLLGGGYTYRNNSAFADSVGWVVHTQEVRRTVESVHGSLAGSEIALRDYLLTRDEQNRRDYERLAADAARHLNEVESLVGDNLAQRRNVLALRPTVEGRLAAMTSAMTAFNDFGLPAARAVINVTRNIHTTQEVGLQTTAMDAEEARLLEKRQAAVLDAQRTTLLSLLITMGVATGLFTALFRGIHREMRARRDAESALRSSDLYNRSILDSSPDCLGVLSLDGRLKRMTPRAQVLMDIDDFSQVENADWIKIWKGDDRKAATVALDGARHGVVGRFRGFCPTLAGVPKWWDVIVMPIIGADGEPEQLLAVSRDITEAKKNEDDLRDLNRFMDSLFESLPLMVYVKDAASLRYIRMNRECERVSGLAREDMIGKTARDLVCAAEADRIEQKDREALDTGVMVEIEDDTVETQELGQRTRHTMKVPIFDEHGSPRYLLGIATDVTERKLTEHAIRELNSALELKASQLEVTNKELESFSYSVSHDLRAPLRAIDGFALMIEEDYNHCIDAEGLRYLAVIRENSKRMGSLIDDLLQFSRLGRLPVVSHDINMVSLVQEVVEESRLDPSSGGTPIHIGNLPPAHGDRGLLRQVWTNLISNAVKYSSKSQAPVIQVSGRREGTENVYSVRDNGVGFNMEYVEKLFGVFQRLHRADEFSGTGVGLAIVHRVVTRHGGRVWAEGRINEGAVFSFTLPAEPQYG